MELGTAARDGSRQEKSESVQTIRVLLHDVEPYITSRNTMGKNLVGFYGEIWNAIKAEMGRSEGMRPENGPRSTTAYVFEETRVEHLDARSVDEYDVVVGLNPPLVTRWARSSPLFIRTYTVVYRPKTQISKMFYHIFIQKYIPIMVLLVMVSVAMGLLLYRFTPRANRRNAIWQTVAGMMGEFGYLTEKLSDHHRRVTVWGYLVNLAILMICLYGYIYLQATINTTMIYAKDAVQIPSKLKGTLGPSVNLLAHPGLVDSSPSTVVENIGVSLRSLRPIAPTTNDANREKSVGTTRTTTRTPRTLMGHTKETLDAYVRDRDREHDDKKQPHSASRRVDGVLVDTVAYNHARLDPAYGTLKAVDRKIGHHAVSLAVHPRRTELLYDLNASIHRLHSLREIRNICDRHASLSSRDHCVI